MTTARGLEELATFTPLGIRFWDPALDEQVRDALAVRAWPVPARRPVVAAFRTASDVYAFQGLPGLRAVETPAPGTPPAAGPRRRFVVAVEDARRRFLPAALAVDLPLPYRGLFLVGAGGSPPERVPGFLLYSAASRPKASWLAAVRGELALADGAPAGHAVVRVHIAGEAVHHGIADAAGRFAVLFPQPTLADGLGSSPGGSGRPLPGRTWNVRVEVLCQPGRLETLPGTSIPDTRSVLLQRPARLWPVRPEDGGGEQPEWHGQLSYGEELIVRTEGLSRLLVSPQPSSPNA